MFSRTTCMITKLKNHKLGTYNLSQQIHISNGAFSFSNQTSPDEFVSRPLSLCQCITHPYCAKFYTKNPRPHTRTEDILCFFFYFSESKKNCHRHLNGFGDISLISLVCNRAKSSKKTLFHTMSNLGKATLNLRRWELLA